jgi:hypothetical protein
MKVQLFPEAAKSFSKIFENLHITTVSKMEVTA